jgi:hypothetical protein
MTCPVLAGRVKQSGLSRKAGSILSAYRIVAVENFSMLMRGQFGFETMAAKLLVG